MTVVEPERDWPVVEVFGPTIQGEGPAAGCRCFFVRLGGCDYRCSWCDSMYAVDPAEVRKAPRLTAGEVMAKLDELGAKRDIIVLSGGNPALHQAGGLVGALHRAGHHVHVETQGTVWRDWLAECRLVVTSPKPPSAAGSMRDDDRLVRDKFRQSLWARTSILKRALKIVVGDEDDYAFAVDEIDRWRGQVQAAYLSALTPQPIAGDHPTMLLEDVAKSYRWLCERAANDPALHRGVPVVVLPQLHAIAWGTERGR